MLAQPVEYVMNVKAAAEVGEEAKAGIFGLQYIAQKLFHRPEVAVLFAVEEAARIKRKVFFRRAFNVIDGETKPGFRTGAQWS